MMRHSYTLIRCVAMALLLCVLAAAPALAGVGATQRAEGDVVAATGGANTRLLSVGSPIVRQDVVSTGPASLAHLKFQDDSRVAMGADSVFEVLEFLGSSKGALNMGEGVFRVLTGKIVKRDPGAYTVQTPMMALGFRGTEVGISVRPGMDRIALVSGGPMEATDFETRQTILVYQGQMITKRRGQAPTVAYISNAFRDELEEVSFFAPATPARQAPPTPPARVTQPPAQVVRPPVVQPKIIIPLQQIIPRIILRPNPPKYRPKPPVTRPKPPVYKPPVHTTPHRHNY